MYTYNKWLRLGIAVGIVWGLGLMACTLISIYTGYAAVLLMLIKSIYPGYEISISGSLIGLAYGLLDGIISVLVVGWVYKLLGRWSNDA